jgi:hypothetical protein
MVPLFRTNTSACPPCAAKGTSCADLNALTRADYSDAQWQSLCARAIDRAWEPPSTSEMCTLRDMGWQDAGAAGTPL